VRVLAAAVQEHHLRIAEPPLQHADRAVVDAGDRRQRAGNSDLLGVLVEERELVTAHVRSSGVKAGQGIVG
jgi:hypothetical protein